MTEMKNSGTPVNRHLSRLLPLVAVLACGLSACTMDQAAMTPALNPSAPATGCLHHSVADCMASLARFVPIDPKSLDAPDNTPDIDGKRSEFQDVRFSSKPVPNVFPAFQFAASMDGDTIQLLSVFMPDAVNLTLARTEDDFDKTKVFELFSGIAPSTCTISKTDFYKQLYHAFLAKTDKQTFSSDFSDETTDFSAKSFQVCGLMIRAGWRTDEDANLADLDNPQGFSAFQYVQVSDE